MARTKFMQTKEGQRIKIYLVVGLALVLVSLAYFRFFHKKPKPSSATPAAAPFAKLEVPQPEIVSPKKTVRRESAVREAGRMVIRDIFAPLRSLPRAYRLSTAKRESANRGSSLQLRGVIIGGKNSIAIINDKLVRKGERVGDYKVIRIREKEVFLRSANESVRLKLENNE